MNNFGQFPPRSASEGPDISTATPEIVSPIHHVKTTASLTTLTPPVGSASSGFIGPVYLVADSVFSWTTSGNIGGIPGTTLTAGSAYAFVYCKSTGKWNPVCVSY